MSPVLSIIKYNVTSPSLIFLLEMAYRGLHIAFPISSYCYVLSSLHVDVCVVVLSKGPLSATAYPCHRWNRSWSLLVKNLCSQVASFRPPLSTRLVWSSDVEKQECAENGSSLWWNAGHELAEFLPSLMSREAVPWQWQFLFCYFFWWSVLGYLSPRFHSSGKKIF